MRAVLQRVKNAAVSVGEKEIARIGPGLLIFLAIARGDQQQDAVRLCQKSVHLRIFSDAEGKMNRSLIEQGAEVLVVSQFTLLADCSGGRRPSFINAAPAEEGKPLYCFFLAQLRQAGFVPQAGEFQAAMVVSLENDGPVTILLDSKDF
jgi:D-tyrosyl-tRNA(Tyr) deacylase